MTQLCSSFHLLSRRKRKKTARAATPDFLLSVSSVAGSHTRECLGALTAGTRKTNGTTFGPRRCCIGGCLNLCRAAQPLRTWMFQAGPCVACTQLVRPFAFREHTRLTILAECSVAHPWPGPSNVFGVTFLARDAAAREIFTV